MIKLPISKYHSLANDYVVVDLRAKESVISIEDIPKLAVELCKRKGIVGADGVACLISFDGRSANVRVFNPDGSESQLSVNGLRCAARKLLDEDSAQRILIQNDFTTVSAFIHDDLASHLPAVGVRVPLPILAMSQPFFDVMVRGEVIVIDKHEFNVATLLVPHIIGRRSRLRGSELSKLGESLQKDVRFPHGINVSYMTSLEGAGFFMSTFERGGAGLVKCSSSALICGAAMLWRDESVDGISAIAGYTDGGVSTLIREDDISITAIGNATHVYDATLDIEPSSYFINPRFAGSANMDEIDAYDEWLSSLKINELKTLVEL